METEEATYFPGTNLLESKKKEHPHRCNLRRHTYYGIEKWGLITNEGKNIEHKLQNQKEASAI
jgi:hypothetical protein